MSLKHPTYLGHELRVFGDLPGLHYTDDGCLDQEFPVLLHILVGNLRLLLLFRLHGDVDVDAQLLVLVLVEQLDHGLLVQVGVGTLAGPVASSGQLLNLTGFKATRC